MREFACDMRKKTLIRRVSVQVDLARPFMFMREITKNKEERSRCK